jgi:ubiquitin-conjugating enzyme E2 variant
VTVLIQAALALLAVDFVSGLVHWIEDTFWDENTPVVGRWVVRPNVLHHENGSAFLGNNWLQSSWDLLLLAVLVVVVAAASGLLCWQVWLFAFVGANANQVHKWAHLPPRKVPLVVRWLQRARVLLSFEHHANHHRHHKNSHYCVITNVMNPILDAARFWRLMEVTFVPLFGTSRRTDLVPRPGVWPAG